MKSYTDIEQSRKLAEILPIESSDMLYVYDRHLDKLYGDTPYAIGYKVLNENVDIPCWSLSALLDVLPYPQLSKDKLGSGKEGWMVSVYPDNCRYDSCWHDNQVDACVEMILKLSVLKLL